MTVDQTTTTEKPKKAKAKPSEVEAQEAVEQLEEDIEVLEPVAKVVERKLTYNGEEKVFLQHEMSFFAKLKFFRLMSGTLRLAAQEEGGTGGIGDLLQEAFAGAQQIQSGGQQEIANVFLDAILRLVELSPDFVEETYLLALSVKPEDQAWVILSFQNLDDEEGMDILDTFVAQNGKAISDFFGKRLGKVRKRITDLMPQRDQEGESEITT